MNILSGGFSMGVVQKWGNSLGFRIPAEVVKKAGLKSGDEVSCDLKGETIIIQIQKPKYSLEKLLDGVTSENSYHETDTGEAVGNERIW
jgi:antitoxin MazE